MDALPARTHIAAWLQRLADHVGAAASTADVEPLLQAYATAAERAGFDADLVRRIRGVSDLFSPTRTAAVRELKAIASEAIRRYGAPPMRGSGA